MKTQAYKTGLLVALLVGAVGCGANSATDSGSSDSATRVITGSVSGGSTSVSKSVQVESGCVADVVMATDSSGNTKSASVKEDCAFELELEVNKTYALSLTSDGEFIAALLFRNEDGLPISQLTLEDGSVISLGTILVIGGHAFPEHEPLVVSEDGEDRTVASTEDEENQEETDELPVEGNDDADTTSDGETEVGDIGETPLSDGEPHITQISPSNGDNNVATDKAIVAWASCIIDPSSVTARVFNVGDSEGDHVACAVTLSKSQKEVTCAHDRLQPKMSYVLNLEGLHCAKAGGGSIRSLTWHFRTK